MRLSILLVRVAVVPPELAFAESIKLILNASQDLRHVLSYLLQVKLDIGKFLFQRGLLCISGVWHLPLQSCTELYKLFGGGLNWTVYKRRKTGCCC